MIERSACSFLLTFAFAEQHEIRKDIAACKGAFDRLIAQQGKKIDKLKAAIEAEAEEARGPPLDEADEKRMKEEEDIEIDGEPTDLRKRFLEREARGKAVIERRQPELNDLLTSVGVVWNMYIRCMRRSEVSRTGILSRANPDRFDLQGLRAARITFSQARKSAYISWHVFEASGVFALTISGDEAYQTFRS